MTKHKFMNKEFQWTDELVKEFMLTYNKIDKLITGVDPIMQTMQEWKASHTPEVKRDWEIIEERKICYDGYWTGKTKIFSVRRLSDNEVFSVGDEVEDKIVKGKKNIINFFVDGNNMLVGFMGHGRNIKDLSKLPQRTKLFTTEDGEPVFEGEKYWWVDTDIWTLGWSIAASPITNKDYFNFTKIFPNEEKAKEYVTLNKPLLSVADILGLWVLDNSERLSLIELAKSKQS